jgi:glycosyltransferase involved in cell wall biosynthesis
LPLLSILVCSVLTRRRLLNRLLDALGPQLTDETELRVDLDNARAAIGEKRNRLLDGSSGQFLCFFDDDDLPAPDYVARLTAAIRSNPAVDCIGFRVRRFEGKKLAGIATHTINNGWQWTERPLGDGWEYLRSPNHLTPIRRDIAQAVRFKPVNIGEDRDYAHRLMLGGHLKTETFIDAPLYDYLLRDHPERTGEIVHPRRWVE